MDLPSERLRVDVLRLQHQPGTRAHVDRRLVWEAESGASRIAPGSEVHAELTLESVIEGILLTGTITAQVELECARCLRPLDLTVTAEPCALVTYEWDEDADYVVEGHEIDLEPIVRDEIALALPEYPTCGATIEECDLPESAKELLKNGSDPAVDREHVDPRFAGLDTLLGETGQN